MSARRLVVSALALLVTAAGCTDGRGTSTSFEDGFDEPDTRATDGESPADSEDDNLDTSDSDTPPSDDSSSNDSMSEDGSDGDTSASFPDPEDDPDCVDQDGDGFYAGCGAGSDCHDGNPNVNPDASEVCGDQIDNDCSGGRDNGCSCDADADPLACYTGPAGTLGRGACRAGTQTCADGEWSTCSGQTLPSPEVCNGVDDDCDGEIDEGVSNACGGCGAPDRDETCGNGLDDDCNGIPDDGCPCTSARQECYPGPADKAGVGACEMGTQSCSSESWSACEGAVMPQAEVCGDDVDNDCDGEVDEGCECDEQPEVCDGIDNDCDGEVDEGCNPCLERGAGNTPWEIHRGGPPACWDTKYDRHGAKGEYDHADIPPPDDDGWEPEPDNNIQFEERSTMCGEDPGDSDKCECLKGGDFTYFQTYFTVKPGIEIESLKIDIDNVDDGARITIFNEDHPDGVVDPGSYAFLGGGSTTDLAEYLVNGRNRVVITHVDDCCRTRRIAGVTVTLNGEALEACEQQN